MEGVKQLMKDAGDVHYVFESTGGYEREAAWWLLKHNKKVTIVNPKRVRDHAKSKGQLAKTDNIDARMITSYAQSNELRLSEIPSDEQIALTGLVNRLGQVKEFISKEKNYLEGAFEKQHRFESVASGSVRKRHDASEYTKVKDTTLTKKHSLSVHISICAVG